MTSPSLFEASISAGVTAYGGRAVLYRTKAGYAVVKTDLSRAAGATVDAAKRSASWLARRSRLSTLMPYLASNDFNTAA